MGHFQSHSRSCDLESSIINFLYLLYYIVCMSRWEYLDRLGGAWKKEGEEKVSRGREGRRGAGNGAKRGYVDIFFRNAIL